MRGSGVSRSTETVAWAYSQPVRDHYPRRRCRAVTMEDIMTIFHDRGLPNSRPDKPKLNPTLRQAVDQRERARLNTVSFAWHREAIDMYEMRQQEQAEHRASKRL